MEILGRIIGDIDGTPRLESIDEVLWIVPWSQKIGDDRF